MRVAVTLEQCWHRVPGGTAVAALELTGALADGTPGEVEVVGVAARHRRPPARAYRPGVPVRPLPLPRPALYEAWHRWRRPPVERATGPVDVVHATSLAVPPRSVPLVVTIHDVAFVHDPSQFTARGLRLFRRGLALATQDADLVLASSEATLGDLVGLGFDRARLRHVPLGVHVVPAPPADVDNVRQAFELHRPYVLFAGTLEPRKNLGRLLEAFAALPDELDLVLAGPQGWGEAGTAAVGARVRPLGFVTDRQLRALYAGAAVFAYPSLREGFGLPVLEAMAQGAPVVTSAGTATEEAAGGAAVLVDPTDVGAIAAGLEEALAAAPTLAAAGRARAAGMTWARTAERTVAAYREVLGR